MGRKCNTLSMAECASCGKVRTGLRYFIGQVAVLCYEELPIHNFRGPTHQQLAFVIRSLRTCAGLSYSLMCRQTRPCGSFLCMPVSCERLFALGPCRYLSLEQQRSPVPALTSVAHSFICSSVFTLEAIPLPMYYLSNCSFSRTYPLRDHIGWPHHVCLCCLSEAR